MTNGTIHAVDENLFLVEGEWPVWPVVSLPGPAVLRSGARLYLIDTGAGPHLRSAVRAVAASFGRSAEVTLINSGRHPGLVGNNDLLDCLPAQTRRYLRPPDPDGPAPDGPPEWPEDLQRAYPPIRPTSVPGRDLDALADRREQRIGRTCWSGWTIADGLVAVEATSHTARLAFYLEKQRAMLLPEELALAPAWPGSDVADVLRVGPLVLELIEAGTIDTLSLGFGPPLDAGSGREAVQDLVDRARISRAAAGGRITA